MFGMADSDPTGGLWNWRRDRASTRNGFAAPWPGFGGFGGPAGRRFRVFCDVYPVGGDYPTLIDVYFPPGGIAESTAASAVAVRLEVTVMLPDDTLNPTRYVLAEPDGSLRAVHVDEQERTTARNGGTSGRAPAPTRPVPPDRVVDLSRFPPTPTPERPAAA